MVCRRIERGQQGSLRLTDILLARLQLQLGSLQRDIVLHGVVNTLL